MKIPINFSNYGVTAGTTTRESGNFAIHTARDNQELSAVKSRRQELIQAQGFSSLITLNQIHSDKIHRIDRVNLEDYARNPLIDGDGLLTSLPGIMLGVLTADCVPVFYTNFEASFCGIVHAGWRGAQKGIHLKMLDLIKDEWNIAPGNIEIAVGPFIHVCCYEVGQDLIREYPRGIFIQKEGRTYLDLGATIRKDLMDSGIPESNIYGENWCTKCGDSPRFYSYRGGDQRERILSYIGVTHGDVI